MMKKGLTRILVNGAVLAGVVALGITVYQVGTNPRDEVPDQVLAEQSDAEDEEEPMVDAGTDNVEAKMEEEEENPELVTASDTDTQGASEETEDTAEENAQEEASSDTVDMQIEEGADLTQETDAESAAAQIQNQPELNFSEDTLMQWPVNGNILQDYNMEQTVYFATLDQYKLSPAIAVQAVEGAPVIAAAAGTVYSIEESAETGTTVTMELGNGYQAIYGQLTDLAVSEGETVKEGTTIGYVNTPTKYYTKEGSNLYFAMKKNGEPIDPIAYLP